jgi:hypothetical protein
VIRWLVTFVWWVAAAGRDAETCLITRVDLPPVRTARLGEHSSDNAAMDKLSGFILTMISLHFYQLLCMLQASYSYLYYSSFQVVHIANHGV